MEKRIHSLANDVLNRHMQPEDQFEVAALLESFGWNDQKVQEVFGFTDVFELAEVLWNEIKDKIVYTVFTPIERKSVFARFVDLFRSFLRGSIFALPMAVSVISMLTLKFSLWSFENLSVELATSIAIGTILSFITVGGFTQAIARRGFYYIIQGNYDLAKRITLYFIKVGFTLGVLLSILILILNILFSLFPYRMLIYIVLYFFLLNTIWLTVTVMYILRREIVFTGLIMLGISFVYFLYVIIGFDIIVAQLLSISFVSILGIILAIYFFNRESKRANDQVSYKLPRISITIYSVMHYFIYGFLYFCFLYLDRVIAWSTNDAYMPYVIWFRGEYELGLDFALLTLIIPMGLSEVAVTWIMQDLAHGQRSFLGHEIEKMNQKYLRIYYRMLSILVIISIISAVIVYMVTLRLNDQYYLFFGKYFIASEITYVVMIWGTVAYVILSVFLTNAVILFSLSQPTKVNEALFPGIIINFIIGFLLSRWFEYYFAVFGLLAGILIAMILSTIKVTQVLKKLDYYLYAAS